MSAEHQAHTLTNGIVGTVATMLGVITSVLPQIEAWLRIVSLLIGIAVGLFTLYRIYKGKNL